MRHGRGAMPGLCTHLCLLMRGRLQSVLYFQRALKVDKRCRSAWTLMGHEFLELKNPPAAIGAPSPASLPPQTLCAACWHASCKANACGRMLCWARGSCVACMRHQCWRGLG